MEKVSFLISVEEFTKFLEIVEDLNKIGETHKIKWFDGKYLIYSVINEGVKINAVKTYFSSREEIFTNYPEDLDLTMVMLYTKNWCKQYKNLLEDNKDIEVTLNYSDEHGIVYSMEAKNEILQLTGVCGDVNSIKDMPLTVIKDRMNPKIADWSIQISGDTLKRIKKLSKLNDEELLTIEATEEQLAIRDGSWELKLDKGDANIPVGIWNFKKEHLDRITCDDSIQFCMFETYVLIKEKNSLLLFSLDLIM